MKGDFSRVTFDPRKHHSRVLLQQGRVQLDADLNEQADIVSHYLRMLTLHVIGPHGGPASDLEIRGTPPVVDMGPYYVGGLLCEGFEGQRIERYEELQRGWHLLWLDVWERLVTHIEDDRLREVALGGADTAVRTKVECRLRAIHAGTGRPTEGEAVATADALLSDWTDIADKPLPTLQAFSIGRNDGGPDIVPPDARYQGVENRLYRVEIHRGGGAYDTQAERGKATFKWSRDNGSALFSIRHWDGERVTVEGLERDSSLTLTVGDRVELLDDRSILDGPRELLEVTRVDHDTQEVVLSGVPDWLDERLATGEDHHHARLRRWDHRGGSRSTPGALTLADDGAACVEESALDIEDGIQVRFHGGPYLTGDSWLIAARTATRDIEWPRKADGVPASVTATRTPHHVAPIAFFKVGGCVAKPVDVRRTIRPIAS